MVMDGGFDIKVTGICVCNRPVGPDIKERALLTGLAHSDSSGLRRQVPAMA